MLSVKQIPKDAQNLFRSVFLNFSKQISMINNFRGISSTGIPSGVSKFNNDLKKFIEGEMVQSSEFKCLFSSVFGSTSKTINQWTKEIYVEVQSSIDAASIIFAHSAIDELLLKFCHVVSKIEPEILDSKILKKPVEFEKISLVSVDDIRKDLINNYLKNLERESLLKKCDLLYVVCKPPKDWNIFENYKFRLSSIKEFDELRHNIIHRSVLPSSTDKVIDWLTYIRNTGWHFMSLLIKTYSKYGLKITF